MAYPLGDCPLPTLCLKEATSVMKWLTSQQYQFQFRLYQFFLSIFTSHFIIVRNSFVRVQI